ncbi:16S rRNA (cytidine(1402)-2'-O)-methyltransferase [Candidatus Photodesmus anomalopis]|uniref:16S rRNA (cytidine(1402)-2'-O)-methyltransferase n=1 Tax=Candidatus Photodesmus anomalopis TaxID=28176 RepID=UPI000590E7C3|nr:16S rRNA (cytidine(1402)-2'-O)-methyltransferase [Candidatus Photodesmus katoptron]
MFSKNSILYIVPTPIGNLSDISQRAINILSSVDVIATENIYHSRKLFSYFKIKTRTISFNDHNEKKKSQVLIARLLKGQSIALVSDAGTPLISDPGYYLVNQAHNTGIKIVPLPGPCAVITALSASGLPSNQFTFGGFLPEKKKARKDKLLEIVKVKHTCIFYESPHRIIESLKSMLDIFGPERQVVLARELTKIFETIQSMPLGKLVKWVEKDIYQQRGEIVLLIHGYNMEDSNINELPEEVTRALTILVNELSFKKAISVVSKIYNCKKNVLYKWGLINLITKY